MVCRNTIPRAQEALQNGRSGGHRSYLPDPSGSPPEPDRSNLVMFEDVCRPLRVRTGAKSPVPG